MADSRSIRAGGAAVELLADSGPLQRGLAVAEKKLRTWGQTISTMGTTIALAGAARLAAGFGAVLSFANEGTALQRLSTTSGATVEELSALAFAARRVGGDLGTVQNAAAGLDSFLLSVADGSGEAGRQLALMGVRFADLQGKPIIEKMKLLADGLHRVGVGARQTQLASAMGLSEMLPLLRGGAEGLDKMLNRAQSLGAVMSGEDAQGALAFTTALNELKGLAMRLVAVIGASLAPAFTSIVNSIGEILPPVIEFIDKNRALIVLLAMGAALDLGLGIAMHVLGTAVSALSAVFGVLKLVVVGVSFVFSALYAIIGLGPIAILGLVAAVAAMVVYWKEVSGWLSGIWTDMMASFTYLWGGISDAIAAGNIELAFQIVWATIKYVWTAGINWVNMMFLGLWKTLEDTADDISTGLAIAFQAAWSGLKMIWSIGVEALLEGFHAMGLGVLATWNKIISAIKAGWAFTQALLTGGGLAGARAASAQSLAESQAEFEGVRNQHATERAGRHATAEAERAAIQAEGMAIINDIERQANIERQRRQVEFAAQQGLADAEVAAAQEELDGLIAQAARAADEARNTVRGPLPNGDPRSIHGLGNISSQGTFSAAGAAALSGSSTPADVIARNTERANQLLERIARNTEEGGAFAA